MLDVTGVDVQEKAELKHLVRMSTCKIENALVRHQPGYALPQAGTEGHPLS
jgi:hypothetical protein